MDTERFRSLPPRLRALVAVAVLLDGRDAGSYLITDAECGHDLYRAAEELSDPTPDLRMPLVGTLLRGVLKELK